MDYEEGFYIENSKKQGWFLIDLGHRYGILHLIWSTKIEMCKFWEKRAEVEKLLEHSDAIFDRAHIVNLTKNGGYYEYFKR